MHVMEQLASERIRDNRKRAEQMQGTRRLRALRRVHRTGHKAERRMIAAWSRAAELESLNY
ncbi:MAG: hypothetical protein M3Z75_30615 [Actinomycetota bacterium]|nr:hypothetical protein [Actinomycetota bacterium]